MDSLQKIFNQPYNFPIYWKLSLILSLLTILLLTLSPNGLNPIKLAQIDKFYHICAFAALAFTKRMAFYQTPIIILIFLSAGIGLLIEVIQYFIPNRSFSVADIIADIVGAILGLIIADKLITKKSY